MTSPLSLPDLLRAQQWDQQSLCREWRVIDVAAHLAWAPVLGPAAGAAGLLRSRLSVNQMIAASAVG